MFGRKKYNLTADGWFEGQKEKYYEGQKVELSFPYIATDTNYSFFIDGEPVYPPYEKDKGYVIRFAMPARDVTVSVTSQNTMLP